jgi:hypothetical protein
VISKLLDLLGAACLAGLAYFAWPPAALGVIGVAALAASWRISSTPKGDDA